jgi:hypothetical protein
VTLRALVETAVGVATVDLETEEVVELEPGRLRPRATAGALGLPLLVAADRHGSRIVAVVDRRPPLVVSDDAGHTWREAGAGLPPGRDVAISPEHPDHVVFASASRLYLSEDGCRFWRSLAPELLEATGVAWDD